MPHMTFIYFKPGMPDVATAALLRHIEGALNAFHSYPFLKKWFIDSQELGIKCGLGTKLQAPVVHHTRGQLHRKRRCGSQPEIS